MVQLTTIVLVGGGLLLAGWVGWGIHSSNQAESVPYERLQTLDGVEPPVGVEVGQDSTLEPDVGVSASVGAAAVLFDDRSGGIVAYDRRLGMAPGNRERQPSSTTADAAIAFGGSFLLDELNEWTDNELHTAVCVIVGRVGGLPPVPVPADGSVVRRPCHVERSRLSEHTVGR